VAQSPHDSPAKRFRRVIAAVLGELFPEIAGARHVPFRARVLAVKPVAAGVSTLAAPGYTAMLQPLRMDGSADDAAPILYDVPIQALWAGNGAAFFRLPEPKSIVRVAFDYGDPSLPVILGAVTDGQTVPDAAVGELVIQQSASASIRIKATGAMALRLTPGAKLSAGNGVVELLAVLDEFMGYVESQITFSNGGGPTGPPNNAALLTAIRAKLAALKE
jgi:hypothetical protein